MSELSGVVYSEKRRGPKTLGQKTRWDRPTAPEFTPELDMGPILLTQSNTVMDAIHKQLVLNRTRKVSATDYSIL